jgi:outer membrane receptor protein involved in Fe transport
MELREKGAARYVAPLARRLALLSVVSSVSLLTAVESAAAQASDNPGDIVVTATKRETTLQTTPLAVSVLSADAIAKRNLVSMDDYLASLPGVSYQDRGNGSNTITIRGIGFGDQLSANTPTGSYFGEVSVTGLGPQLNGNQAGNGDIKMIDVARVEVLRGPQGTLFGSGSLGGTVRVIPNAPDLTQVEGRVQGEVSNTARRGATNYMLQGVVNLPVIQDQMAVRVAGYHFFNDGFVDNVAGSRPSPEIAAGVARGVVARDRKHVGSEETSGVRGSLLWKPADGLSLTLTHLFQRIKQDGLKEVETTVSATDYLQVRPATGVAGNSNEGVTTNLNLSNAVAQYDWSWGSLLNSTAYIDSKAKSAIALSFLGSSFIGTSAPNRNHKEIFINEFRFTSKWDFPVQMISGLYYEDRSNYTATNIIWSGAGSPPTGTTLNSPRTRNKQKQFAAFGELAYTPWDPFTLTFGARYYNFEQSIPFALTSSNPVVVGATQGRKAKVDGVNLKVNAAYEVSDAIFLYAQWAQGFREPRFQGVLDPLYDRNGNGLYEFRDGSERLPQAGLLDPDEVETYEGGVKFKLADGRLRGSLTGFYTNWNGIPVSILTTYLGAAFYFNAGKAVSKGVEFEVSGKLPANFYAQFSASWIKTNLGNDAESRSLAGGISHAELPGSPDYNAFASLEKRFAVAGYDAYVRADWTYLSHYYSVINQTGRAGGYSQFGAGAGVAMGRYTIGLFAKNLTNRKDFTWIDNTLGSGRAYRLRPRTIGINFAAKF